MPLKKQPNKKEGQERRRYPRVSKNVAIKIKDKDADVVTETKNLSCIGAYAQVNTYIPILTRLKITLLLPRLKKTKETRPIACEGTVVRIERSHNALEHDKYNIAIYFNQISKGDMKSINTYVKDHLSSASGPEGRPGLPPLT